MDKMSEAMSDVYGQDEAQSEPVTGSVEFKQHKNTDKGSVSIEASADDMQELAKVLKLAGLTLPSEMNADQDPIQPEPDHHDHEVDVVDVSVDDEPSPCGSSDDVSYSTDKEVLKNFLQAQLKNRLS
jgi:hypothetical protein